MDEYIKRSELLKLFTVAPDGTRYKEVDCDNFPITVPLKTIKQMIREAPAADVRPVVYGKWIMAEDALGYAVCSNCHDFYMNPEFMTNGKWNFCPKCGADMRPRRAEEQPPKLTEKEKT